MPKFLTVPETATLLRKSDKSVYRLITTLPGAFKVGGTWLIDEEVLLSSLKRLAESPKGKAQNDDRHGLCR